MGSYLNINDSRNNDRFSDGGASALSRNSRMSKMSGMNIMMDDENMKAILDKKVHKI